MAIDSLIESANDFLMLMELKLKLIPRRIISKTSLTLVRVHMENSRNYFSSKRDFTEATFLHKAILSLVDKDNSSPSTNFILRMIHMDEMDESIKVRRPSRWVVLTEFLDLISDKYTFLLRRDLVLKSILYLISPRLMDLLLAAFRKI